LRGDARAQAALAGPELPEACADVWTWFLELNAARGAGAFGPVPLAYGELDAWARLTGRRLARHEVRWLKTIDAAWCAPAQKEEAAE
jgi:hypothetical protein